MKIAIIKLIYSYDYYSSDELYKFIDWTDKKDITEEDYKCLESFVNYHNKLKDVNYKYLLVCEPTYAEFLTDVDSVVKQEKARLKEEQDKLKNLINKKAIEAQEKALKQKQKLLDELEKIDKILGL